MSRNPALADALKSLADLVTPAGHRAFLQAFRDKTRWSLQAARLHETERLLPWRTIEALVGGGLVPVDNVRVAINGRDIARPLYTDERGRLKASAVLELAAQGATLVLNDIGAFVPAIGELAAAIERDLRCKVGVNTYISFGAISAFTPHSDAHDVLILHIHGEKRWRSFGAPLAYPLKGNRPSVADPQWEAVMTPGDLLYLPRGEVHAAVPEVRPSVHLTIGLTEATGLDLLRWLEMRGEADPDLRRDVCAVLEPEARMSRDQALIQSLHGLLAGAEVSEFLADQDRERSLRSVAVLKVEGRFLPETLLCSALRRRLDLAAGQDGDLLLTLGGRQIRLGWLPRRALVEITNHHQMTVSDLAARLEMDWQSLELQTGLADLARHGLVGIVDG